MEHIEQRHTRPVHVLRHRFEASNHLIEEIQKLLEPSVRAQKLSIFATRLAILDGNNYHTYRYHDAVKEVHEVFGRKKGPVYLNGNANFLELQDDLVRVRFQPLDQIRFNTLLSGFDTLDMLGEQTLEANHYLYTDVAADVMLKSKEARDTALRAFRRNVASPIQRRLNYVTPLEITGKEQTYGYTAEDDEIASRIVLLEPNENETIQPI